MAADDMTALPTRGRFLNPLTVIDGVVLKTSPFEVWERKEGFSDVPFLVGTTEQEADYRSEVI